MRVISDLIDVDAPALPQLKQWIDAAAVATECFAPSPERDRVLLGLQVTTHATLGAVAYETGGLLIDDGWLRVIGLGAPRFPRSLLDWNEGRSAGFLLVADDAIGGYFAINGGALGDDTGAMYYWAPDCLEWESLEIGYSAFVEWAMSGRLAEFYGTFRWDGWQADLKQLSTDQCFDFYPPLCTKEGSVMTSSRKAVPLAEHYALNVGKR